MFILSSIWMLFCVECGGVGWRAGKGLGSVSSAIAEDHQKGEHDRYCVQVNKLRNCLFLGRGFYGKYKVNTL